VAKALHPSIRHLLDAGTPVVADGAWGTELQALGLRPGECPDAWNLHHPDRVERVAQAYVEAGSRVILSNTFGANRLTLGAHGMAPQAAAINRAGAAISRRAAGGKALVFASIGPTGKMLATEETTESELAEVFAGQAQALAEGGADGFVVETMSDLAEAVIAVTAAKATGLPVVASMTYTAGKEHDRTSFGVTPEQAAAALAAAGADAVGANCGLGVEQLVPICKRLRAAGDLPVWIKPNAGMPKVIGGKVIYPTDPADFAAGMRALVKAGATFIGGCCGTGPAHIRLLVAIVAPAMVATIQVGRRA
jgi:methionine synthase I (cobalamin-dependent)